MAKMPLLVWCHVGHSYSSGCDCPDSGPDSKELLLWKQEIDQFQKGRYLNVYNFLLNSQILTTLEILKLKIQLYLQTDNIDSFRYSSTYTSGIARLRNKGHTDIFWQKCIRRQTELIKEFFAHPLTHFAHAGYPQKKILNGFVQISRPVPAKIGGPAPSWLCQWTVQMLIA